MSEEGQHHRRVNDNPIFLFITSGNYLYNFVLSGTEKTGLAKRLAGRLGTLNGRLRYCWHSGNDRS